MKNYWLFAVIGIIVVSCAVALGVAVLMRDSSPDTMQTIVVPTPTPMIETTSADDVDTPERTESEVEPGAKGDVLYVDAVGCGIADPAIDAAMLFRSPSNFVLVSEIHAGLMEISHPDNIADPALAEGFSVSDDGLTYEFRLKKDIRFSDGSPITAKDVKWSWERAMRLSTETSRANDVLGSIVGAADIQGSYGELSGLSVIDDESLAVKLARPRSDFLFLLADPIASVLKRANVEGWGVVWDQLGSVSVLRDLPNGGSAPLGAGPFRLSRYSADFDTGGCALESNPHYWRGESELDAIVPVSHLYESFGLVTVRSVYDEAFLSENIDYYYYAPSHAADDEHDHAEHDQSSPDVKLVTARQPPRLMFLLFNPAYPPFDDVKFRRALVAGTDRDALFPYPVEADGYILPSSFLSVDSLVDGFEFRPDVSEQEFADSKYAAVGNIHEAQFDVAGPGDFIAFLVEDWAVRFGLSLNLVGEGASFGEGYAGDPADNAVRMIIFTPEYPDPHAVMRNFVAAFGKGESVGDLLELEGMIEAATGGRMRRNARLGTPRLKNTSSTAPWPCRSESTSTARTSACRIGSKDWRFRSTARRGIATSGSLKPRLPASCLEDPKHSESMAVRDVSALRLVDGFVLEDPLALFDG